MNTQEELPTNGTNGKAAIPVEETPSHDSVPRLAYLQAFVEVKRKLKPVIASKFNDHFKSHYADIGAVLDTIETTVLDAGLVLEQWTEEAEGGTELHTTLTHIQTGYVGVHSICKLRMGKQDMPALGSGLTYGRRQQVMCVLQLATKDDDGKLTEAPNAPRIRKSQRDQINGFYKKLSLTSTEFKKIATDTVGKTDPEKFTFAEAQKLLGAMEGLAIALKKDGAK